MTAVHSYRFINAPAVAIWQALTDGLQMKEWYFDIPDFELRIGATFNFYEPGDMRKYHHRCTVMEIVPLKKLVHTWTYPEHTSGETLPVRELSETPDEVRITHSGLENFAGAGAEFSPASCQAGWDGILTTLKNFLTL
jgi:uncharacterized protein YndB with AHSA1/START domain